MPRSPFGCLLLLLGTGLVHAGQLGEGQAAATKPARPPAAPEGEERLKAVLFQSPLTCALAVANWVQSSEDAGTSGTSGKSGPHRASGPVGGVPRACIIAVACFVTLLLVMTLWSLAVEELAAMGEEEMIGKGVDRTQPPAPAPPDSRPPLSGPSTFGTLLPMSTQGTAPPLCPKLMLPQGSAQFRIPTQSIRKLRSGIFPVEIFGASRDPLLHAWLPRCAGSPDAVELEGGQDPARGVGLWLQLTTTRTSRHPHACIGPFCLRGSAAVEPLESVQILGPKGAKYGSFLPNEDSWRVVRDGATVLAITASFPFPHIAATDTRGRGVANGTLQNWDVLGAEVLVVQVNQGADAMLSLICILAFVLLSVDLAVPSMKLGAHGGY